MAENKDKEKIKATKVKHSKSKTAVKKSPFKNNKILDTDDNYSILKVSLFGEGLIVSQISLVEKLEKDIMKLKLDFKISDGELIKIKKGDFSFIGKVVPGKKNVLEFDIDEMYLYTEIFAKYQLIDRMNDVIQINIEVFEEIENEISASN